MVSQKSSAVEVLFSNSAAGRIQGKLHTQEAENAPVVLLLAPHPQHGGSMDNKIIYSMYKTFFAAGYTVLRINYSGVGKSTSVSLGNSEGELNDAAVALDWIEHQYPTAQRYVIAGFSFGAWIGMQLLMRRPEIDCFIAVGAPTHMYDFSFLSPCPVAGLFIHGTEDEIAPIASLNALMAKMRIQKSIEVHYEKIDGADHFFTHHQAALAQKLKEYLAKREGAKQRQAFG
jgi:alpha/beta superfamily hydrolase